MAERALQRNNGSPRGYGQPRRRGVDPSVIMDDQTQQVYGPPDNRSEGVNDPSGQDPIAYAHGKPQVQTGPGNAFGYGQEPLMSTGSGRFGAGARMPGGYGQGQQPNPAYNQRAPRTAAGDAMNADPWGVGLGSGQNAAQVPADSQGWVNRQTAASQHQPGGQQDPYALTDAMGFSREEVDALNQRVARLNQGDSRPQRTAATGGPSGYRPGMSAMQMYGTGDIEGAKGIQRGQSGVLEGFNTQGWDTGERGSSSIKNTFGKIASRYDQSQPGALRAVMADPEFQQHFPMARIVEHPNGDLIDFGDGMPVDVLRGAVAGGSGQAWAWQPSNGASPSSPGMPGPAAQAYAAPFPQAGGELGVGGQPGEVFDESTAQQLLQYLMGVYGNGSSPEQGLF